MNCSTYDEVWAVEQEDIQEPGIIPALEQGLEYAERYRPRPKISCLNLIFTSVVCLLLAAILVPNFIRARAQGRMGPACKSNLKNIGTALEMYSTDNSGHYTASLSALTPNYLRRLPECPQADEVSYKIATGNVGYNTAGFEDYYIVWCDGANHTSVKTPAGFPQYDGLRGLYER